MFTKFFVTRWMFDTACARADAAHQRALDAERRLDERNRAYDELVMQAMELKKDGFALPLAQAHVKSPLEQLGPLTRAAIADMGHGQSGAVRRGMTTKAIALALELRGDEAADRKVAAAVRKGEQLTRAIEL